MVEMNTVAFIFTLIGLFLAGGILGFFLARYFLKKEIEKKESVPKGTLSSFIDVF